MSSSCRFIDSFGFEWQAHEVAVPKPAPAAQREKKVLYFFSRGATRVLNDYPRNWAQLSWVELEDLCAQGRAVHRDGPVDLHPDFHSRRSAV
ncbi:MAG: hypothetical protein ACREOG_12295 [Gemmatimonadaceae bacterium]